jgi:hypothetical protein
MVKPGSARARPRVLAIVANFLIRNIPLGWSRRGCFGEGAETCARGRVRSQ